MTVVPFPNRGDRARASERAGHPSGSKLPGRAPKQLVAAKSDVEAAVPRDRWTRPMIIQDDGSVVAYRRASSVAEALENHYGLNLWQRRMAAMGLAQRPDLVQSLHTASKGEIDAINESAMEQAGAGVAARNGTTMHALTELLDKGEDVPGGLPPNIMAMLDAYVKATARFTTLDTERFVVQDKIKVAGTYDRRVFDDRTGLRLIGDLKTGQNLDYLGLKTCAQVAVYASGQHYNLDGEREEHGASKQRGLLIHLPWVENPQDAECELRWLDLRIGRAAIKEAFKVEEFRKMTANQLMPRMKND